MNMDFVAKETKEELARWKKEFEEVTIKAQKEQMRGEKIWNDVLLDEM